MNEEKGTATKDAEEPTVWGNIGKIVLLVVILVAAWFILERLMGGK